MTTEAGVPADDHRLVSAHRCTCGWEGDSAVTHVIDALKTYPDLLVRLAIESEALKHVGFMPAVGTYPTSLTRHRFYDTDRDVFVTVTARSGIREGS